MTVEAVMVGGCQDGALVVLEHFMSSVPVYVPSPAPDFVVQHFNPRRDPATGRPEIDQAGRVKLFLAGEDRMPLL